MSYTILTGVLMKIRSFIILAVVILVSAAFSSCRSVHIKGNGDMVTSERAVSPFEKIQASGSAIVNYHASLEYRVVVTVDSNLEEYARVYTDGNMLKIGMKERGSYSFTKYIVDVYCPNLSAVSISGSGVFNGIDKINASTFALAISGSGKVNGTFECEDFTARISGSGDVAVSGSAREMHVDVSGSGNIAGNEFQTNSAVVKISGAGRIHIWVLDYLNATVSGSGRIKYRGNPKIDYTGSGSGRLQSEI
jgi:hypothetical protein